MKSRLISLALMAIGSMGFASTGSALTWSMFFNSAYVDTASEGTNMRNTVIGLGHTVNTFTGITAADWTAAGTGVAGIIIPEMELRNLATDLDSAAMAALRGYVSNGGCLVQANMFQANSSLPNGLFGWSLTQTGNLGPTNLNAGAAAGTPFAGGPAVLSGPSAVEGVSSASLPGGALNFYSNATSSSVFGSNVGSGHYVYLGFDWFTNPTPADWTAVTRNALNYCAVPEPASIAALGGLFSLVAFRRSKRASK